MTDNPLFSFHDLVARVAPDFDTKRWKIVRHLENSREAPDFARLVLTERSSVEFYQRYQGTDVFRDCEGFFSFVGLPGRRALFFGAYAVVGDGERVALQAGAPSVPASLRPLWEQWAEKHHEGQPAYRYVLTRDTDFAPLEGRVVIDWGAGALAWHQWKSDKPVLEIREAAQIPPCPHYPDIDVSLQTLVFLARHQASNPSWVTKLSSVGGIYLLTDHRNGRLYVGQAGAVGRAGGFWARWQQYAAGASGNTLIDAAFADGSIRAGDPEVTMSILEVVPLGRASKARLDELESRWKVRLRSRRSRHGLNDN